MVQVEKSTIFAAVLVAAFVIGGIVYFLFLKKPAEEPLLVPSEEKTMAEILQDLTAPKSDIKVPEQILKDLTAP